MLLRLALVLGLVGSLSTSQAQPFELTRPGDDELAALAQLTVDDSPPAFGGTFDLAAVEGAALRQADLLPAEEWELDSLAAALGPDPLAAFAFVRDSIAVDAYRGVLRGANGTLAARGGSTVDRALLLRALLEASGETTRLAIAELGEVDGDLAASPLARLAAEPLAPADPSAAVLDVTRLAKRARRDYALVRLALTEAGVGLGDDSGSGAAGGERLEDPLAPAGPTHVWVQLLLPDGSWLDLDPSRAEPGSAALAATTTADAVPAELFHEVMLSLVAETLDGGDTASEVVLEQRLSAVDAASREIWLYFQPEAAGLGGAMADLFEGKTYVPVLMIDGETAVGSPFSLGGGGDDSFFGGFLGGGGPELISLRLELAVSGPGFATATASRTLFDRVAPGDREAGVIMTELLEPLPEDGVPTALAALHHVMVSTGGANLREHAVARAFAVNFAGNELLEGSAGDYPLGDLLLPLAVADQAVVVASERTVVDGLRSDDVRAYIGRPRVFLSSLEPLAGEAGATAMTIDLALDGVSFTSPSGEALALNDAHAWQLWYGALQSALETEVTLARSRAVDPVTARLMSVSLAMSEAQEQGRSLEVMTPSAAETVAGSAAALRAALRAGDLAVVVGDAARGGGFWAIDQTTGATRSVMEPGLRIGFIGGGNYTNASTGGPRWVVDPKTANTIGYEKDGKFYRYGRKPPSRCSGGQEYVMLLGCVSLPAGMTVGMTYGVMVTAVVSWATAVIELALLL